MTWFKKEEMARCFRANGARCRECPLRQPAEKLPDGVEENLQALVREVLDPARAAYGKPISVNSGYRCQVHNKTVGGVANSQHMKGEAADISAGSIQATREVGKIIEQLGKFDQLIYYPTFVHVSYKRNGGNRHQVLRKTAGGYQKIS